MTISDRRRILTNTGVLSLLLALTLALAPCQVHAHGSAPVAGLNHNSLTRTVPVSDQIGSAVIHVGKQNLNVTAGTLLTQSEQIALQQVVSTGHQSLILNGIGQAVGGWFQLNT